MSFVTRIGNSWQLFKRSMQVIADHPKLLFFPVVISAFTIAILLFFVAPIALQSTGYKYTESAHWQAVADSVFERDATQASTVEQYNGRDHKDRELTPKGMAYFTVIYFVSMFLGTFFATAFYHEILSALKGGDVLIGRGLNFAFSKLPAILLWSLFAGLIGYLIRLLEERVGVIGRWILAFVGISWSVAAVFAIPIIVMEEEKNPVTILKRSASTLKQTWGESLAGFVGIRIGGLLILLATLVMFVVGIALTTAFQVPWLTPALAVLWFCCILALSYTLSVASNIFRCALYLFAAEGQIPSHFDRASMDLAWKMKKA